MMPEGQCPHPGRSYGRGIGLEDAADNGAIREHVVVVIISRRRMDEKPTHATCAF
jgi:hypothetical protein